MMLKLRIGFSKALSVGLALLPLKSLVKACINFKGRIARVMLSAFGPILNASDRYISLGFFLLKNVTILGKMLRPDIQLKKYGIFNQLKLEDCQA